MHSVRVICQSVLPDTHCGTFRSSDEGLRSLGGERGALKEFVRVNLSAGV
jgi:hypothetical protein